MLVRRVRSLICLAAAIAVVACGGKRPPVPVAPPAAPSINVAPPPPPPAPPAAAPVPPATETDEEIFARKTLDDLNAERHLAPVYFELDSAGLTAASRVALERNAAWLKRWSSVRATVEGHCDARGTSEYNLALGDRRAQEVRRYLVSLGIAADRMVAVSKGKEQPICTEPDETCWRQNRRGHFIIIAK